MRKAALVLMCLSAAGCERKLEAPALRLDAVVNPKQPEAHPAAVCNAQGGPAGWELQLDGAGLVPVPRDLLTGSPKAGMPVVTLQGPETFELPSTAVFWQSSTQLSVDVPTANSTPAHTLAVGDYTVLVRRPETGQQAQAAASLKVVPPPHVTAVTDAGFVQNEPTLVTIDGSGFRQDAVPQVTITRQGTGETAVLTDVTVVSGTQMTAMVPATVTEGVYDLTVANPEGCSDTLVGALVVSFRNLGLLTLEPRFGYQLQNTAVTIVNTVSAADQEAFSGAPEVTLRAPLKSAPDTLVDIPLRRVAYLNGTTITAVVPDCSGPAGAPLKGDAAACAGGILPGGPYELRVRDAGGARGVIPAAQGFVVLEKPAPSITAISPSAADTQGLTGTRYLTVTGQAFGAGAKVQLLSRTVTGAVRVCDLPPAATPSATPETELHAEVPTSFALGTCSELDALGNPTPVDTTFNLSVGQYVVRVQNAADPAYANFAALSISNPSRKPAQGPTSPTTFNTARAEFPLVVASDDVGNRFLYALGGTSDGATPLASVEAAQLSLFGDVGGECTGADCHFRTLDRTPLPAARRGATAVVRTVADDTSYVYVMGGMDTAGNALGTVERAQVLKVGDAPDLQEPTRGTGTAAPADGTYYYRVSAVLAGGDALNPGGETLASDRQPAKAAGAPVVLTWACRPGVASYRVYRTLAANDPAGTERFLTDVSASGCTGSPATVSFTDTGAASPAADAQRPLPAGALGKWVSAGTLAVPRAYAAARTVGDSVYVVGGHCVSASLGCPGTTGTGTASAYLASLEKATFGTTGAALAFAEKGKLANARQRLSLAVAGAETAPLAFTQSTNASDVYLLAVGGDAATGLVSGSNREVEVVKVRDASGDVTGALDFTVAGYNTSATSGGWAEVAANGLYQAGSTGTGLSFRSGPVCAAGSNVADCTGTGSFAGTLTATAMSYRFGGQRFLSGSTLFRAYVYVAGGYPTSASTAPSNTIELITY